MGCDIHCYIEYKEPDSDKWRDFGGCINPGRNYSMFGAMAGVRVDSIPFVARRGFPADCSYSAFNDNTIYISEGQKEPFKHIDGELYYSPTHAAEYVAKGYCEYVDRGGRKLWVTNCDHHSHSWLTADEFELAIASYLKAAGFQIGTMRLEGRKETADALATMTSDDDAKWALHSITEYWAILSAMRCFEAQGKQSRLVFWFDN